VLGTLSMRTEALRDQATLAYRNELYKSIKFQTHQAPNIPDELDTAPDVDKVRLCFSGFRRSRTNESSEKEFLDGLHPFQPTASSLVKQPRSCVPLESGFLLLISSVLGALLLRDFCGSMHHQGLGKPFSPPVSLKNFPNHSPAPTASAISFATRMTL
jgi:hypothetical protein